MKLGLVGIFVILPLFVLAPIIAILGGVTAITASQAQAQGGQYSPSDYAKQHIQPPYILDAFIKAGQQYGVDWTLLAGVASVECSLNAFGCQTPNSAGAVGMMQFLPDTWAKYGVDGNNDGNTLATDPVDAIYGAANYLKALGITDPQTVDIALCHYWAGALPAFQDCVAGAASPYDPNNPNYAAHVKSEAAKFRGPLTGGTAAGSGVPYTVPIPSPITVTDVRIPHFPTDIVAKGNLDLQNLNQCVAGAKATWVMLHNGSLPPLAGNAVDLYNNAIAAGWQTSPKTSAPQVGWMVVYGTSFGTNGHIATVVAVDPGKYEVIEQNYLDEQLFSAPNWHDFDNRSLVWPDSTVEGFIVGPPA